MTDEKQLMESAPVPLGEAALSKDGSTPILIISPGWGSSGYYSPEVLERAAPRYAAGTQMFWDHPTRSDEQERPERSLRDLAATLSEAGHWEANGPRGPGIYSRMKVFPQFAEAVKALAPNIGLSHYARGPSKEGEAEGRRGPIIEDITGVRSVDFVTLPGRGGAILEAFREAAASAPEPNPEQKTEEPMIEKPLTLESLRTEHPDPVEAPRREVENSAAVKEAQAQQEKKLAEAQKALEEAKAENARLKEVQLLVEAKTFVEAKVRDAKIPDLTKARIVESLGKSPAVKDGKLDEATYTAKIEAAVKAEAEYLAKLGAGRVEGMGAGASGGQTKTLEETDKELVAGFMRLGMSEAEAKAAVKGA